MRCVRRSKRAFTLTELLIVLAVLAMLTLMAAPTLSRIMAIGRSIKCQKNLASISQAYNTYRAKQLLDAEPTIFSANTWRTALQMFLGNQDAPHFCPEDDHPEFTLPISTIRIYGYSQDDVLYDVQLFDTHPYWLEGDHNDFLPDKPGMWRVNNDVYSGGRLNRREMPMYTPGNKPHVSWWIIEDQRYGDDNQFATGDQDFNDFDIRLTDLGGGVYEIDGSHGDAGYNFGIVDAEGVETREGSGGRIGPLSMEGEGGSYGVNWMASKFRSGHSKLLAMDFPDDIVYAGSRLGSEDVANWDLIELRHLGKLNYAMTDGSVHSAEPTEIDPSDPANDEVLWTVKDR